mmetsp:Transcript_76563/g.123837  ORF Transcript_76563/g.123837 Transcript_76563/m.123837 type:complete len:207 (+) Transcript_76563:304-924(+)
MTVCSSSHCTCFRLRFLAGSMGCSSTATRPAPLRGGASGLGGLSSIKRARRFCLGPGPRFSGGGSFGVSNSSTRTTRFEVGVTASPWTRASSWSSSFSSAVSPPVLSSAASSTSSAEGGSSMEATSAASAAIAAMAASSSSPPMTTSPPQSSEPPSKSGAPGAPGEAPSRKSKAGGSSSVAPLSGLAGEFPAGSCRAASPTAAIAA